jgi:hypothetical protein
VNEELGSVVLLCVVILPCFIRNYYLYWKAASERNVFNGEVCMRLTKFGPQIL